MDTKIIKKYGEDILCYRMRTARQKKRMQYEDFEKHLVQLDRELMTLYRQRKNLGWEPLLPPVQKGWKRFFVLRDDVARSQQADFFQAILDKINTWDWSHRKDFVRRKRHFGKKIYVVKSQKLQEPWPAEFSKLQFGEAQKRFFHEAWKLYSGKHLRKRFVFSEPWRFVLRVRPNIITKVKTRDDVMEARLKEINDYLDRNGLRWTQARLLDGSRRWRYWYDLEKYDEMDPFRNWPTERILDSLKDEL